MDLHALAPPLLAALIALALAWSVPPAPRRAADDAAADEVERCRNVIPPEDL